MKFRHRGRDGVAVAILLLTMALPNAWPAPLAQGDKAPDLANFGLQGTLPKSLAGNVVLLDFWASWCGPCKQSFPVLEKLHQRYGKQGLIVIGVSVDEDAGEMRKFLQEHAATFTILRDARQKLVEHCEIETMPTSFLIDRTGTVKAVHNGFRAEETEQELESQIKELLK